MQATLKTRWFDLGHLKQAALVIGVIGSLAIGTLTTVSPRAGAPADTGGAAVVAAHSNTFLDYREGSMFLPVVPLAADSSTFLDYRERNANSTSHGAEV